MFLIASLRTVLRGCGALLFAAVLSLSWPAAPVHAADPIKVGFSMSLAGAGAPNGKQLLIALEIWRDDVNATGGLLGRPVELVYYDDQANPSNQPVPTQNAESQRNPGISPAFRVLSRDRRPETVPRPAAG
jgi:hypothetical protein